MCYGLAPNAPIPQKKGECASAVTNSEKIIHILRTASATNFVVKTAQQNFIKSQKRSGSDERTVTAYCS